MHMNPPPLLLLAPVQSSEFEIAATPAGGAGGGVGSSDAPAGGAGGGVGSGDAPAHRASLSTTVVGPGPSGPPPSGNTDHEALARSVVSPGQLAVFSVDPAVRLACDGPVCGRTGRMGGRLSLPAASHASSSPPPPCIAAARDRPPGARRAGHRQPRQLLHGSHGYAERGRRGGGGAGGALPVIMVERCRQCCCSHATLKAGHLACRALPHCVPCGATPRDRHLAHRALPHRVTGISRAVRCHTA
jgi:hypothetical protein